MDPTEIDTKEIDDLVKACQKNMEKAGCKNILSLKDEISKIKPAERDYFVQKYSRLFSKPLPVPAAAAPKEGYVSLLGPSFRNVPRKIPSKGGKSRRRRNKKGKKKTNKRRRN